MVDQKLLLYEMVDNFCKIRIQGKY